MKNKFTLVSIPFILMGIALFYGTTESVEGLLNGQVDVVFLVISAASNIIKDLLSNEDIDLFSFERSQAYSKNFVYSID